MKANREHVREMVRKAATLGLCAALAGSITLNGIQAVGKAQTVTAAEAEAKGNLDVSDIVESAMPSVVAVGTQSVEEVQDFYSYFGRGSLVPEERVVSGGGSGFIASFNDTELMIVTNAHVVENADQVTVTFIDDTSIEGVVKGYDLDKDVAVISVKLDDISDETLSQIQPAAIGDSDELKVGEQVVVIGNAMLYGQSVTTGIVSAKNRQYNDTQGYGAATDDEDAVSLIQTDAAINPGNSGGPLLNMKGEVVGISNSKLANTLIEGMCYALSYNDVSDAIDEIMAGETRERLSDDEHGVLGISVYDVSAQEAMKYRIPQGALIDKVTEGGAAEEAGVPEGCIIVKFENKTVDSVSELLDYISFYGPGEEVEITVYNLDTAEEETYTVTLGEQEGQKSKEDADEEEEVTDEEKESSEDASDEEASDKPDEAPEKPDDGKSSEENNDTPLEPRDRGDIFEEWRNGTIGN